MGRKRELFSAGVATALLSTAALVAGASHAAASAPDTSVSAAPAAAKPATWDGGGLATTPQQTAIRALAQQHLAGTASDDLYPLTSPSSDNANLVYTDEPQAGLPAGVSKPAEVAVSRGPNGSVHVRVFSAVTTSALDGNGKLTIHGSAFDVASDGTVAADVGDPAGATVTKINAAAMSSSVSKASESVTPAAGVTAYCIFTTEDTTFQQNIYTAWYVHGQDQIDCDNPGGAFDTDALWYAVAGGGIVNPAHHYKTSTLAGSIYGYVTANSVDYACKRIGPTNSAYWWNEQSSTVDLTGYIPIVEDQASPDNPLYWCQ